MRVVKNGDVHVSAPIGLPEARIRAFIDEHREWIDKARERSQVRQEQRAAFFAQLPLRTRLEKQQARERLSALIEPMVAMHAAAMGVAVPAIQYKSMISRWGICNIRERKVCFSLYLLLLPEWCVEHVVVHELCHLLEPSHNARFYALMDRYFPRWRDANRTTRRIYRMQEQ